MNVYRYDEQAKMVNDLESVLQTIQARLKECQQWDVQHQVSYFRMYKLTFVLGIKILMFSQRLNTKRDSQDCQQDVALFCSTVFWGFFRLLLILYVEQS